LSSPSITSCILRVTAAALVLLRLLIPPPGGHPGQGSHQGAAHLPCGGGPGQGWAHVQRGPHRDRVRDPDRGQCMCQFEGRRHHLCFPRPQARATCLLQACTSKALLLLRCRTYRITLLATFTRWPTPTGQAGYTSTRLGQFRLGQFRRKRGVNHSLVPLFGRPTLLGPMRLCPLHGHCTKDLWVSIPGFLGHLCRCGRSRRRPRGFCHQTGATAAGTP
jgi:hypothetical protein